MIFEDRRDAGRALARVVRPAFDGQEGGRGSVVLGLPRGGVPVAYEIARELTAPLDIVVVRKLGVPGQEELAMGAIASGGTVVINHVVVRELAISAKAIEEAVEREKREIERRELAYREDRVPVPVGGRTVILVDDGLATGATMLAAVRSLRPFTRRIVVAIPIATKNACEELRREADQVFCVTTPHDFFAIGMFYRRFEQTPDDEVRRLLREAYRDMENT